MTLEKLINHNVQMPQPYKTHKDSVGQRLSYVVCHFERQMRNNPCYLNTRSGWDKFDAGFSAPKVLQRYTLKNVYRITCPVFNTFVGADYPTKYWKENRHGQIITAIPVRSLSSSKTLGSKCPIQFSQSFELRLCSCLMKRAVSKCNCTLR